PAADTRISKRGSLVLIGNSCENRPGSGRILLPPDQLRQFCTNGQERTSQPSAIGGRFRPAFVACSNACASWRTTKSSRCFPTAKIAAVGQRQPVVNNGAYSSSSFFSFFSFLLFFSFSFFSFFCFLYFLLFSFSSMIA